MPRIRSLKIGFFQNEELCDLSPWHRLLFEGLWVIADREGRLEDRPKRIKAELFPYDELDVDALLTDLAQRDFVLRYDAAGVPAIAIVNFQKHQRPNNKEAASTILAATSEQIATQHEKDKGVWSLGSGLGNGLGDGISPAASAEPPSLTLFEFPTVGTKGTTWALTERQVAAWQSAFPSLDILAEARHALAWLQANPGRRKTTNGMPKFLVNWFGRTTDRGSRAQPAPAGSQAREVFVDSLGVRRKR